MVPRHFVLPVVAALALLLPAASAAGSHSSTKVIISLRLPAFHGTLKSAKGSCTHNRTVKLFRKRPGPDKLVGTDRSNAKAEWTVLVGKKLPPGASFYAKAPATSKCGGARSKALTLG